MGKKNPKIDAYIAKARPYAKPILKRLRTVIHKTCPKVVEDIKWGAPFYLYQDRVLCATMAFKAHAALVFWKAALIKKQSGKKAVADLRQMRRVADVSELISDRKLAAYIKLAMHLNEPTTKLPPREKRSTSFKVPGDLTKALRANSKANAQFKAFSPSKKKDYVFWIIAAKTQATRDTRIETAVKWIAQGKSRNWKYEMKKKA